MEPKERDGIIKEVKEQLAREKKSKENSESVAAVLILGAMLACGGIYSLYVEGFKKVGWYGVGAVIGGVALILLVKAVFDNAEK